MGNARQRPKRLAVKLAQIRAKLGLTQEEIRQRFNYGKGPRWAGHISEFERDIREPPLMVLLSYARLAGISTDVLIDDELDLPDKLPVKKRSAS